MPRGDAQIQRALNHYGFDAGTADGVFGPRTVAAIRRYQSQIGAESTGTLTVSQSSALLSAYANATQATVATAAGGAQFATLLASLNAQDSTLPDQAPTGTVSVQEIATVTVPVATICGGPEQARHGASLVSATDMETIVGGYCTALSYALAESVEQSLAVPDLDPASNLDQCRVWLQSHEASVSAALSQPPEQAVEALRAISPVADTGQQSALRNAFVICHGLAEANGDPEMSFVFSALAASAGGEGYGELVAARLAIGHGTTQDQSLGSAWYYWTAEALAGIGRPLVSVQGYDHVPLLVAFADSAEALTAPWSSTQASSTQTMPSLPGFAMPAMTASAPAIDAAAASALPPNFDAVYGMSRDAALQECRTNGPRLADLGRITCRGLAAWAGDGQLFSRFAN